MAISRGTVSRSPAAASAMSPSETASAGPADHSHQAPAMVAARGPGEGRERPGLDSGRIRLRGGCKAGEVHVHRSFQRTVSTVMPRLVWDGVDHGREVPGGDAAGHVREGAGAAGPGPGVGGGAEHEGAPDEGEEADQRRPG